MTHGTGVNLRWIVVVAAAAALVATGAAATYFVLRSSHPPEDEGRNVGITPSHRPPSAPEAPVQGARTGSALPDVVVVLSQEAIDRAGITVAPVGAGGAAAGLRLPGIVEPNAYRQVIVTPLVAGRITRVLVQLGEHVRKGQTMAEVFSPELAEAYTRYVSARAALGAHDLELQRTQKLVDIGAASRQELERIQAEHTAQTAELQSARSRLELLGLPASTLDAAAGKDVGASISVPAPIDGIVTERLANMGLNVDPASRLFTVVDLSTVWVVANLYERDFSRVRVGSPATVTTIAYPELALKGRVSYIDPQVSAETRTAKVRVEVQNVRNELRLGMFADVAVGGHSTVAGVVIPQSAVQSVGDRQVVYLANPRQSGRFTEREVRLGQPSGDQVEVLSGVQQGDLIVTEGTFFVRAERERLGLRPSTPAAAIVHPAGAGTRGVTAAKVQTAKVVVGEQGYEPAQISLRVGTPARITFVRTSDRTCGTEIVFSSLNINRPLPLNEPVVVEFTPSAAGDIAFTCGMNMLRGTVVVQ